MASGKKIPDETRAAIMASLLAGQSGAFIAQEFNVSESLVSSLKKICQPLISENAETLKQKKDLPSQVLEVLEANLNAIKNIATESSRPEYIAKQSASEVAVLLGVIADKAFRILSAMEPEPASVPQQLPETSEYQTN